MELIVERNCIRIIPENATDVAYIEDTLGLLKEGDFIQLKRLNIFGTRSVAGMEAKREEKNDHPIQ